MIERFERELPKPDCEFTAPGSETDALDCWQVATWRYVDDDGATRLLLCGEHHGAVGGLREEQISESLRDQ